MHVVIMSKSGSELSDTSLTVHVMFAVCHGSATCVNTPQPHSLNRVIILPVNTCYEGFGKQTQGFSARMWVNTEFGRTSVVR